MPSIGSRYTFADFLQRLERSPVAHMSPLYHEHRLLFVNRPDMLSKAVLSISWERGLALLQAAYYTQPIAAETYGALLARMLRHNRHVERSGAGQLVSWQAAMRVMNEAVITHGTTLPTRVTVSILRLLAPHRQWRAAIDVLKLSQANGQLTKPMLLDAAHACATPAAWPHALRLLMHLHAQDPPLLHDAIQSMRPPGSSAMTASAAAQALLQPSSTQDSVGPTPAQQHILDVLNSVVGTVPHEVALRDPLCMSYLTHLLASTTLSPELKVQRATAAMAQLPWTAALQLLCDVSEPNLLTDQEWKKVWDTLLIPEKDALASAASGSDARKKRKKGRKKNKAAVAEPTAADEEAVLKTSNKAAATEVNEPLADTATTLDAVEAASTALFSRLQLLRASPLTSAAMIAVMVEKLPTPEMAVSFIRGCATQLAQSTSSSSRSSPSYAFSDGVGREGCGGKDGGQTCPLLLPSHTAGSVAATRHPVVVHALLRNCARHDDGWAIAANVLLEHSGAQVATPTELLSALVQQLRQAKQVSLVVRLLHEHIIPSNSVLTACAWEDVLECALAHNRALQLRAVADEGDAHREHQHTQPALPASPPEQHQQHNSRNDRRPFHRGSSSLRAPRPSGVHWVSALSWVLNRQAPQREARIQETGTGPSLGATPRHTTAHVRLEQPLTPKMLSLLINICVQGGSPQGALHAMGYARRVDKTELPHTAQIRALLYCMQYDRPFEAEAIVAQLAKKEGDAAAQPLQHLLRLMREVKQNGDVEQ